MTIIEALLFILFTFVLVYLATMVAQQEEKIKYRNKFGFKF